MLPSFLSDAFASLRHPKPIYLVGGPVRDHLLNRPCHDWDFTCAGAKKAARALRRILRATLITLDDHRQIFRLILPGAGERLTIDFAECAGGAIEKDLARRDFTVNAMAVPVARGEAGRVIDPFNGQRDLRRKRL